MRRSSLSRRTALKRSGRPRARNPKRRAAEWKRAYGSKEYVRWCKEQPCIACGAVGFSEVAHIKTGGMGRKDDWTRTVPLCGPHPSQDTRLPYPLMGCHKELHCYGRDRFGAENDIDLEDAAIATHSRWLSQSGGQPKGVTEK